MALSFDRLRRQFPDIPLKRWPEKVRVAPAGQPLRSPRVLRSVRDTEQLRGWLLGFGGKVEVIAPAALRRDIASRLRAAAKRYSKRRR